ncbi:MAG: hypothetical protein J0L88_04385 [Xanthomonadales bacterium]|nr:hypothetical protein [Xanthomonadales bacterium]
MSVETCKARMAAQRDLSTAMDDPAGVRAGDEAMTCTAIIAEMQSIGFQGIDQATAEAARRAGEGLRTTYDRAHADAAELAARQSAAAAAAMLAPQPVQGALSLAQSAEQAALAKRAAAELSAARTRSAATTADAMSELAARLQAHPRYARLMALVQARGCTMDDAPSAPAASDGARPRD